MNEKKLFYLLQLLYNILKENQGKNHKYYNIDIKCNWNRRGEDVGNIKSQKRLMMKFKI